MQIYEFYILLLLDILATAVKQVKLGIYKKEKKNKNSFFSESDGDGDGDDDGDSDSDSPCASLKWRRRC